MSIIQFKKANCKNCYKCIRSCPIKAIAFKHEQAEIIEDECILCGKCLLVCPQNAKKVRSDIEKVKKYIENKEKVYVSLAPSFITAFKIQKSQQMISVLMKLGFYHIEETAIGAIEVSKEYEKLLVERKMHNIISSACPTIVSLIEKYYPENIQYIAPVVSPMIAHAKMMRAAYGADIKIVFIGPCLSKKGEYHDLQNDGAIDAVITFEELQRWIELEELEIDSDTEKETEEADEMIARFYPVPGGILKTLNQDLGTDVKFISIDGIDRSISILDAIRDNEIKNYFIEMNACVGGCLGGPCTNPIKGGILKARENLMKYAEKASQAEKTIEKKELKINLYKRYIDKSKINKEIEAEAIKEILYKTGKFTKEKELNCGACGYSTCREKAIAVYRHKAELHMCLPYMRERAESISNIIINSTPNGIIAMNQDFYIQEVNESALKLLGLQNQELIGRHIYDILNCTDFDVVKEKNRNILNQKHYYEQYDITVEQSILNIEEQQLIIIIIKDITQQEKQLEHIHQVRTDTVEIAQKVIDKQMRVAQEIASLLGETTAETKITLSNLKNIILSEAGEQK